MQNTSQANDNAWLPCNDKELSWCTWTQQDSKHQGPKMHEHSVNM